ncbi:MAG: HAD-IC family P-type ATPase [Clostridia bacterium]|nr:HAD-IC family P-type ATPase [Clostridia bacterium]
MKTSNVQNYVPERFNPSTTEGLSNVQVSERINHGLTNTVKEKYSKSYLSIIINNVCTVFNLLGLIVFVALLCIGDKVKLSDFFFVFFYIANITIGIFQEVRAKKCIDKLSLIANKGTKVIRNGQTLDVAVTDVVLDDILSLGIGNQIPTDCMVLEGDIEVNESLLTGESVAVKKKPGDQLLAGSFITSGVCFARADKVGKDNYVETLSAKAKQYKKPHSEIMNSLKIIIKVISFIIVPIAAAWMIKTTITEDLATAIYKTSTPVIGMIPAGMFLLTSVALAVGIIKLAKHNTLVQDLYSLEMLARVDTICFDKTGTITDGKMTVKEVVSINDSSENVKDVVSSMLGALKDNNQTAIALYNYFGQNCIYKSVKTLPFNSTRKLSAVTFDNIGTYTFGAPEFVLQDDAYKKIEDRINEYAQMGLRVLLLAHSNTPLGEDSVPNDFAPVALIVIADNVREDAISTIKWFKENNVAIKVISGDNPITVSEVSKRVGIDGADRFISLEGLSDEEVFNAANEYTVFGRVTPEQKAILIKALKAAGHVTAMTGDGVNDILALKESDCAISVAAGSDAARNVSHLVLMDNNFNSMPKVVYEGRRVINNVQSSASLFLMKTLFTMMMATFAFFLPYMNAYPYRLSNMIMFEVFITGIPSFFLSFQPNDSIVEGKFISYIIKKSLPSAILMIISVIIIEICRMTIGMYPASEMIYETMGIYVLTFAGAINLYMTCKPLNKFRAVVFFGNLSIILLLTGLSLGGSLNSLLSLTAMLPLSKYWHHLLIVVAVVLLDIPIAHLLQKAFDKLNVAKLFSKNKK